MKSTDQKVSTANDVLGLSGRLEAELAAIDAENRKEKDAADQANEDSTRRPVGQAYRVPCEYQRMWQFEFIPLGFFGRLTVRVLANQSLQVSLFIYHRCI